MYLQNRYLKTIISLSFYSLAITPLLIGSRLYFPFITLKTFYLRALIELMFGVFVYLYLSSRDVRFNKSVLTIAWSLWIIVIFLSAFFGQNPKLSFFSDYERSWGVLTLAHFYLLFIVASSIIQESVWVKFFNFSIFISLLVSIYGFAQRAGADWVTQPGPDRIASTLGNPIYVAIYLLFNIAFCLILISRRPRSKFNFVYAAAILVNLVAFTFAAIRGASIGLFAAAILAMFVYVFFSKSKKTKVSFSIAIVAVFAVGAFLFFNRNSVWIAKWPYLNRILNISLEGATTKTRFIGWRAGLKGFRDSPLLGVGPENYGLVFNKYFEADFYNFAPTETFFDRAHNASIDVLATTGAIGFISYLGIFATFIVLIWRLYRAQKISRNLFVIGLGMVAAYFINNQFVFDDLISLTMFTVFAAYFARFGFVQKERTKPVVGKDGHFALAFSASVVILFMIWVFNYKPYRANSATGFGSMVSDIDASMDSFNRALDYGTFQSQDIRLALADKVLSFGGTEGVDSQKLKNAVDFSVHELEKEMEEVPLDVYVGIKLLSLYNLRGIINNDAASFNRALDLGKKMIELGPERLQIYYLLADTELLLSNPNEAVELLNQALKYNSQYADTYWYLGRAYIESGNTDEAYKNFELAINKGFRKIEAGPLIFSIEKLIRNKDFKSARRIYELIAPHANDPRVYSIMAAIEKELGNKTKAIEYARKAASLDPANYGSEAQNFIDLLNKP